jgi:hypothetical protein
MLAARARFAPEPEAADTPSPLGGGCGKLLKTEGAILLTRSTTACDPA